MNHHRHGRGWPRHPSFLLLLLVLVQPLRRIQASVNRIVCPTSRTGLYTENTLDTDDPQKLNDEISGLAFSATQLGPSGQPILYGINDGGNGERLVVWDSGTGARLRTFVVPGVTNVDWEDLTLGVCTGPGSDSMVSRTNSNTDTPQHCLYIADSGDNTARESRGRRTSRSSHDQPYQILQVAEPPWDVWHDYAELPLDSVSILPFDYSHPSSPTLYADSESLFIDHTGWGGGSRGDLYLVTKWGGDNNRLFYFPVEAWQTHAARGAVYAPAAVGNYDNRTMDLLNEPFLRADMTQDGTVIALGGETRTRLFLRCPGQSVAEALTPGNSNSNHDNNNNDNTHHGASCFDWNSDTSRNCRHESFAWTPDGQRNVQVPEGLTPSMKWTDMDYNPNNNNNNPEAACPVLVFVDGICRDFYDGNRVFPESRCDGTVPTVQPTPTRRPTQRPTRVVPTTPKPTAASSSRPTNTREPTTTAPESSSTTRTPTLITRRPTRAPATTITVINGSSPQVVTFPTTEIVIINKGMEEEAVENPTDPTSLPTVLSVDHDADIRGVDDDENVDEDVDGPAKDILPNGVASGSSDQQSVAGLVSVTLAAGTVLQLLL